MRHSAQADSSTKKQGEKEGSLDLRSICVGETETCSGVVRQGGPVASSEIFRRTTTHHSGVL